MQDSRLLELLRCEQSAMAEFLVALADFDRRRSWAELGHTSHFYFLHRELRLSAGAAFYRKAAAELIQRFPRWSSRCATEGSVSPASRSSRRS